MDDDIKTRFIPTKRLELYSNYEIIQDFSDHVEIKFPSNKTPINLKYEKKFLLDKINDLRYDLEEFRVYMNTELYFCDCVEKDDLIDHVDKIDMTLIYLNGEIVKNVKKFHKLYGELNNENFMKFKDAFNTRINDISNEIEKLDDETNDVMHLYYESNSGD